MASDSTFSSTKFFQEKMVKTNGENQIFCGENGPNLQLFVGYLSYLHQMKLMSQLAPAPTCGNGGHVTFFRSTRTLVEWLKSNQNQNVTRLFVFPL